MRAAVCHGFGEPLVVEDVTLAGPARGEVRVRLAACAVCHSDVAYASGAWGGPLPAVYGHEAAGVVEAVGADAGGLVPGDRVVITLVRACGECHVCLRGQPALCGARFALDDRSPLRTSGGAEIHQGLRTAGFAEEVVVHHSQAVRIRPELALDRACLLACGVVTGYGAVVNTARVEPGDSVAVIGAGGVGVNCIQGAVIAGAEPIIAVDVSPAKLAAAMAFGATHAVDAAQGDAVELVRTLGGDGVDCAIVATGATAAVDDALRLVRRGGTVVIVGMPAGGATVQVDTAGIAHDGIRILGSKLGSTRPAVDIPLLADLYLDGRLLLDELISSRRPLAGINDALAAAAGGDGLRAVVEL